MDFAVDRYLALCSPRSVADQSCSACSSYLVGALYFVGRHLRIATHVSLGKVASVLANAKADVGPSELAPRNRRGARISSK
eukprot:7603066-Pyramimonas_sp.AAC.1